MCRCFGNENLKHYYQPDSYKHSYREGKKEFCTIETKFSFFTNIKKFEWAISYKLILVRFISDKKVIRYFVSKETNFTENISDKLSQFLF